MGQAEYIVRFKGDYSALESDLKKINGATKKLEDDEVIIKLNYDGNIKEFNKVFDSISKQHPELGIQFQYNVNEKLLNQELDKLEKYTQLKLDIDEGNVQSKLEKMGDDIGLALQNHLDAKDIKKLVENYFGYYNTAIKAGAKHINIDEINNRLSEAFEIESKDIKQIFDDIFESGKSETLQLFKFDKSLNDDLLATKERIEDIRNVLKLLKEKGASETGLPSELQKVQDEIKILRSDIQEMQEQLKDLSGEAFTRMSENIKETNRQLDITKERLKVVQDFLKNNGNSEVLNFTEALNKLQGMLSTFYKENNGNHVSSFWDELIQKAQDGDKEVLQLLSDLRLLKDDNLPNKVNAGMVKSGGLIGDDYTVLTTKIRSDKFSGDRLKDAEELKNRLDAISNSGVNAARTLAIVSDEANNLFVEIQQTAPGKMLGQIYGQTDKDWVNMDFLKAEDEEILKLIVDLETLRKAGIGVELNAGNLLYQKGKGFSIIDMDLKPLQDYEETISESQNVLLDSIRQFFEEQTDETGNIKAEAQEAINALDSFSNRFGVIAEEKRELIDKLSTEGANNNQILINDAATEATKEAADAIKKAQDSNSPAELTKPLGKDFGAGYAEGIREAIPEVIEACKEIVLAAYDAVKEASDAKNGEGNNFLDNFINNLKESLDNAAPTIQEKIKEVFSKIDIDNKSEKSSLSSIASEDFQSQFQNAIDETGKYIIKVYGELIDDFKSRLQNSIDETGIYHVDIEGWLYDTFHDGLQRDIDGQEKYIIEVKGRLFDSFKEVLQEAIDGLGTFPIEVKPYMRKGGKIEEIDLPGGENNNVVTVSSQIDEITQAEDRMGDEAQEATDQAKQGLAEIREEAEKTNEALERVVYHYGALDGAKKGSKSHTFGDEIHAYYSGNRNGGRGWADGTGTYVTSDPNQLKKSPKNDPFKKFYVIDTSKLKLYEAHVEEDAQAYYEFAHKLEQYCIKMGSGFQGFDKNLKGIDPHVLYESVQKLFKDSTLTFDEFNAFLNNMAALVKESGMAADGSINASKMYQFKKKNGSDDIKTRFLKSLGFQGTNFSGTSYDTVQSGSVIFDIDKTNIIKSGKTINDVIVNIKDNAEQASEAVKDVFNENNLLSDTTTTLSAIDEITQAEDKMGNEAQESTDQAKQGLAEMREEAETLLTIYRGVDQAATQFATINDRPGTFFSFDKNLAKQYAGFSGELLEATADFKDALYIDGKGSDWYNFEYLGNGADEASQKIIALSQKIRNIQEELSSNHWKELGDIGISHSDFTRTNSSTGEVFSVDTPYYMYKEDEYDFIIPLIEKENALESIHNEEVKQLVIELYEAEKAYKRISDAQDNMYGRHSTDEFAELGKKNGYNSIIFENIKDSFDKRSSVSDVGVILDNAIIKQDQFTNSINETTEALKNQASNQTPVSTESTNAETKALLSKKEVVEQLRAELNLTKKAAEDLFDQQGYAKTNNKYQIEQTAVDELIASLKEKKQVEESQDSSTTSPTANAMQSEVEVVNQAIEAEKKKFDELSNKISKNIPNAIDKKNKAFEKERDLVAKVVDDEIDYFDILKDSVNGVTNAIEKQYDTAKNVKPKAEKSNNKSSKSKSDEPDRDALLQQHYKELRKDAYQSIGQKTDIQKEMSKYYAELEEQSSAAYESASKKTDSLLKKVKQLQNSGKYTDDFVAELNLAQKELSDFSDQLKSGSIPFDEVESRVATLSEKIENTLAKKAFGSVKQAAEKSLTNVGLKIDQIIAKNSAMGESFKKRFEGLRKELDSAKSIADVQRIVAEVNKLESEIIQAGKTGKSFIDQIKQRLRDINSKYIAQYFSFQDIIRYAREAFNAVQELNIQMVELAKVSEQSLSQIEDDFNSYANTAKDLGATISDTISATADWARMGYNVPDAKQLAEVALLYKNVGDGIDITAANQSLISTLQGYQMQADEAEHIVDVFNEVANNYAIDTAGIGEALQRSAASLDAANTSLEQSVALVTAANTVVQNPESVGTTFKTLSARLRGAKTDLEELGEEEDEFTQTTSKLQSLVKGLTGFDILEADQKTFKSIYDILVGIGKEWKNLTDIEQASLGEALFGKRNANVGFAILNNIDTLTSAYETAENAAGSARREQENYEKGIEYSVNKAKAALQELAFDALDSDLLKGLIDMGTNAINLLDTIIDKFGLLKTAIVGIAGVIGSQKLG